MKTKHQDGIELYDSKPGPDGGKHRVRLWVKGNNIANNGEEHIKKSQCVSWPLRVFKQLWKIGACRAWANQEILKGR
jgi:hypothetical protein